jgi:hypothetical protein
MTDADRMYVAILAFRSTANGNETVVYRRRSIRALDSRAARERALALGAEGALRDEIFEGVRAMTEIERWNGEGLAELASHLKVELAAHPLSKP